MRTDFKDSRIAHIYTVQSSNPWNPLTEIHIMTLCKENKTLSSDNMPLSANNGMLLKRDKGCTDAQHTYTFYRSAEEILLLHREKIFPLRSSKNSSALKFSPRKDVLFNRSIHLYILWIERLNENPPTKAGLAFVF